MAATGNKQEGLQAGRPPRCVKLLYLLTTISTLGNVGHLQHSQPMAAYITWTECPPLKAQRTHRPLAGKVCYLPECRSVPAATSPLSGAQPTLTLWGRQTGTCEGPLALLFLQRWTPRRLSVQIFPSEARMQTWLSL